MGILLLAGGLLAAVQVQAQPGRGKIIQGNKLYTEERYDDALIKYRDAQTQAPEKAEAPFNIGAAEYKKNKYEEALKETQSALKSDNSAIQAKAYYNMGNALFRLNKLPEAIQAYTQSLKVDPADEDAKYNLEFARKKLKDQSQKQQQNQDQQQQQQQQQEQQQQDQDKKDQDKKDQEQQQQQQQEQQQEQKQPKPEQMSKDDAARILDALKQNEQNQKDSRKMKAQGRITVTKDW
jgi:Ca-activated chloride channel homolog